MKGRPDRIAHDQGIGVHAETEHDDDEQDGGKQARAPIVDDAAAHEAHALEPDHHGKQERDVEGGLGELVAPAVGIAAGDVVPDLEHDEEHGEEDGCRIDDACRDVVGVAAEHVAGKPE